MEFKCKKCGKCCYVGDILPHMDRGDGWCTNLTKEKLCKIYDRRPMLCHVDLMYNYWKHRFKDKDEYYKKTKEFCDGKLTKLEN